MSDHQQPQITPEQSLAVTLTIAQWRMVLEHLSAPYRAVAPVIAAIDGQCTAQIQSGLQPPVGRGNGPVVEKEEMNGRV